MLRISPSISLTSLLFLIIIANDDSWNYSSSFRENPVILCCPPDVLMRPMSEVLRCFRPNDSIDEMDEIDQTDEMDEIDPTTQ